MSGPSPYDPPADGPDQDPPSLSQRVPAGAVPPPPQYGAPPPPQYGAPPPPQYGAPPPPPGASPWGPAPYPYPPAGAWTPYGPRPSAAARLGLVDASFGARLAAYLLDGLFVSMMALVPVVLFGVWLVVTYEDRLGTCTTDEGVRRICDVPTGAWIARLVVAVGLAFVLSLVIVLVYVARTEGRTGQTWGKRIAGVRTVDMNTGQPIGEGRAIGRLLARQILSGQILYLGFLWMLWDGDKQTWHDKIVRSIVVQA